MLRVRLQAAILNLPDIAVNGEAQMIEGLSAAFRGMWFVIVTPRVWAYALVPALMLVILFCGLSSVATPGVGWVTEGLIGDPEGFWGQFGGWVLKVLLWLVAVLLAALVALVLAQPLSGFALEAVARAQERALIGRNVPHSSFMTALWTSTRATLVMLVVGGIVNGAIFLVDIFFPPATVVTAPVQFIFGGLLLAWNFLDYPLSMRGLGVIARLRWSGRHFEEFAVFGVVWAALLFVPGLFFLILPMGVAGATRLVVAAEQEPDYDLEEYDEEEARLEQAGPAAP
jgi:CysZ protein